MSIDLTARGALRTGFSERVGIVEPSLAKIKDDMLIYQDLMVSITSSLLESDSMAYKVSPRVESASDPSEKLQIIRAATYSTQEVSARIMIKIASKPSELMVDAKTLYDTLRLEMMSSEETLRTLKSNVDKVSEVDYALLKLTAIMDKLKYLINDIKSNISWVDRNGENLNRLESSLRLEHRMEETLGRVGYNAGEGLGSKGLDLI